MAGLDDPAARLPAGNADLQAQLLAAGADVRLVGTGADKGADGGEVVAAIETQPLRPSCRWCRSRDRDRVQRLREQPYVVAVGAVMRQPERDPSCVAQKRTFRPLFALSVGLGPVLPPPRGAFPIAPSAASQAQSIPTTLS